MKSSVDRKRAKDAEVDAAASMPAGADGAGDSAVVLHEAINSLAMAVRALAAELRDARMLRAAQQTAQQPAAPQQVADQSQRKFRTTEKQLSYLMLLAQRHGVDVKREADMNGTTLDDGTFVSRLIDRIKSCEHAGMQEAAKTAAD